MSNRWVLATLFCVIVTSQTRAAGKPDRSTNSQGQFVVDKIRKDFHLNFEDCDSLACIETALSRCRPAHFFEGYSTIEGSIDFADYFVVPAKKGCQLVVVLDGSHGVVDQSTNSGLYSAALEMWPAGFSGNPEDIDGTVFVRVFGVCTLVTLSFELGMLFLKGVGDVLQED